MKLHNRFYISIILLLLACGEKESKTSPLPIRPVKVVKIEALGTTARQYTGTVQAQEFSTLAFKVSGTLKELNVREGQRVKKGTVVARINPYDYEQQYQSVQGNYDAARSIYERNRRLYSANAVAKQNLEIAEADYVQATSAVQIAERTLDYTTLRAPFDGFIEKKYVENFEEILVGKPIVKLVNPDDIEIYFILPETSIQLLQVPKKIFVEFDSQKGRLFTSEIKEYIYSSDGSGIPITLRISDSEFASYRSNVLPGFSCKVTFLLENTVANSFIIPSSALFLEDGNEYVQLIDPGTLTAHKQKVETIRYGEQILVKKGLSSHGLIVTAGAADLQEGQKVTLLQ